MMFRKKACLLLGAALIAITVFSIWFYMEKVKNPYCKEPSHKDYISIEELTIIENYPGGTLHMVFDFNRNAFYYWPQRTNSVYRIFTNDEKEELLSLLEQYKFLEWTDYTYGENWTNTGIRRTSLPMRKDEYYMGVGEQEAYSLSSYKSYIEYTEDSVKYTTGYDNDNSLPEGYNELLDGLWDFVYRHDIKDPRFQYNNPHEKQEMPGSPDYDKIWYFSINEFFGGHRGYGQNPGASLIYDTTAGGQLVLSYRGWPLSGGIHKAINFVDADGTILRYAEEDDWWVNKMLELPGIHSRKLPMKPEEKNRLLQILKKYDVASWREPEFYQNQSQPVYVQEGGYFCWNPDAKQEGVSELENDVRSSYDGFIYLYDTDGRRLRLIYDNTGLPENYNEFRQEIWDLAMEYVKENDPYQSEDLDWRDDLYERGRFYLEILESFEDKGTGESGD